MRRRSDDRRRGPWQRFVAVAIVGAGCAALIAVAVRSGSASATAPSPGELPGKQVFLDYCSFCHELGEAESNGDGAAGLRQYASGKVFSEDQIRTLLEYPPPGMLKVPLRPEQRDALLAYLLALPNQRLITPSGRP